MYSLANYYWINRLSLKI